MKLSSYKLVFVLIGVIGVLIIGFASFAYVIQVPGQTPYSELYLLGPQQNMENYPYNVANDQNYSVYVGVTNHLGYSAYYVLYVKLANQTDTLPNATTGNPSPLPPIYEYQFVVGNDNPVEFPLNFSFSGRCTNSNQSFINQISINNLTVTVDKSAAWDSSSTSYTYVLTVELWLYNTHTDSIEYNDRFVDLQLNFTGNNIAA